MATVTPTLEFYNGSSWVDITADMIAGSLSWRGGLRGGGPTDRLAVPGQLEVELKNGQSASGGLGYYSPDHANKRAGWALGAKIRIKLVSGGNTRYWLYRIKKIKPVPGQYGPRRVEVTAMDYMNEFSKRKVSALPVQKNKRGDELLTTLVASMPFAPVATSYGVGVFPFPYAFHDEQDELTHCMTVLQKITQSELGYIFVDGDATGGETLHYEPHTTRQNNATSVGTLSDTMTDLDVIHSDDDIWNSVKANTYPVDANEEIVVLGTIPEEFSLEPGESRTVTIPYLDDITERRVSGENIITPVAGTDYKMSSFSNNNGSDLNASLTMTPTAGSNTLSAVFVNNSLVKGYVNSVQVRGNKIKVSEKVGSNAIDDTSVNAYGEKSITYNMPYQSYSVFGQAVADEIVRRYKDPSSNISGVGFVANRTATLMSYALTIGISSRITVVETVTGVDGDFFVNGYDYELQPGNVLRLTWTLERAFNTVQFFTIDDATFGAIDGIYLIAPF
jgi:hypothetical protein